MISAETQQNNLATWRVEIDDRADVVFQLRDYLRRMGVPAAVCAPTALEFETDTSVNDLRRFISDWNRVTDIAARLVEGPTLRTEPEAPQSGRTGPRLGELLVAKHLIDEEQLLFALNEARETGDLLGIVLLRKQLIFEDELARTLSHQLSIPYVSVMRIGVDRHIVRLMPADVGERAAAIPVRAVDDAIEVAFADPTDPGALAAVRAHLPKIRIAVSELSDIRLAWRHVQQRAR